MSAAGFVKQGDEWFARQSSIAFNKLLWENTSGISGSITLTYSYKYNTTPAQGVRFVFLYSDGTRIDNYAIASTTYVTKVITSDAQKTLTKIQFTYGTGIVSTWIKDMQIELGSASTEYEPYTGDTYEVTFPSEAGTVYGGTVDVRSGVLTVNRAMVDLGTLNWKVGSTPNCYYASAKNVAYKPHDADMACSRYKYDGMTASKPYYGDSGTIRAYRADPGTVRELYVHDDTLTNLEEFKAAMSGVQLVYELATPVTYHLTPTQINALDKLTILTTDVDNITATYKAKNK